MANGLHTPATDGPRRIVISVDAMGGDSGPAAVVAGLSLSAAAHPDVDFILHGNDAELTRLVDREAPAEEARHRPPCGPCGVHAGQA
jgi:phosphate acyltransferase